MDIRFGNLTTQSGQKINFEDFDKDGDGKITEEEYNAALKEYDLDSVELSNVDRNADKTVTNDEFQLWEQKIQMETALQPYLTKVTTDFTGKNIKYATEMTTQLRELIDNFAEEYMKTGKNISSLAADFEAGLPTKYEIIKENILHNTPEAVKSRVIDEILTTSDSATRAADKGFTDAESLKYIKALGKALETEANSFIKSYTGDDLETDLKTHLNEFVSKTDVERMSEAVKNYKTATSNLDPYIDENELEDLKDSAKTLLKEALNQGVAVSIGGYNYTSVSSLENKINSYKDADTLLADVQTFIDGLNTKTLLESLKTNAEADVAAEEEAKFVSIPGSSYQVDATLIDYSEIDGYYENKEYIVKGKKKQSTLRENLETQLRETINTTIKDQMRAQINAMLMAQGVPTDKIDTIFENVFNQSMTETFEMDGMIKTKNKTLFRRGNARCNIKDVVDNFIKTFNTNITKAIDEMNASSTDMDTFDIDYTKAGYDADGNPIVEQGVDMTQAYANDKVITIKGHGPDYYKSLADTMIEGLRAQFMRKAETMCKANGIEFDASVFSAKFNNAKYTAIEAAVTGQSGRNSASASDLSWGVGAGGATAVLGAGTATGAGLIGSLALASSFAGGVGIVAGAAALIGVGIASLFGGKESSCTLDTGTLIDSFTSEFKKDFSDWVEKQKTENK